MRFDCSILNTPTSRMLRIGANPCQNGLTTGRRRLTTVESFWTQSPTYMAHSASGDSGRSIKAGRHPSRKVSKLRDLELLEHAPDAMIAVDADGRIVFANSQTEKLFGYTSAELRGQSIELLVPDRYGALTDRRGKSSRGHLTSDRWVSSGICAVSGKTASKCRSTSA